MAQKLLLFWRKPARRCWWEGVDLDNVEGVEGSVKVWIRRVWTLEMVSIPQHIWEIGLDANMIYRVSLGYGDSKSFVSLCFVAVGSRDAKSPKSI
jgi:hypothetical protein